MFQSSWFNREEEKETQTIQHPNDRIVRHKIQCTMHAYGEVILVMDVDPVNDSIDIPHFTISSKTIAIKMDYTSSHVED